MKVLSLFDWMACGYEALLRAWITVEKKPNRLRCSECRKEVDKQIKEYLQGFYWRK